MADRGFNALVFGGLVNVLVVQGNGKILVGGSLATLDGQSRPARGRFGNTAPAMDRLRVRGSGMTWFREQIVGVAGSGVHFGRRATAISRWAFTP